MVSRKVKVDLRANESLTVEMPTNEPGDELLFAKLYLWLRESGKLAEMSGVACKMYCAILTRADFEGLDCYPSQNRIAADAGVSRASINVAIRELMDIGLIAKVSGRNKLGNKSNRYVIIKPPLVQKSDKACPNTTQGLSRDLTNPCADIGHKQETENKSQLTTTTTEVGGCGDSDKCLMMILERIERKFKAVAVNASVNIDEITASFEMYSEREIVGQVKRCNGETRLWSGLEYWLENYGKSRSRTGDSMADEVAAERDRLELCQQQAELAAAEKEVSAAERTRRTPEQWLKRYESLPGNLQTAFVQDRIEKLKGQISGQ